MNRTWMALPLLGLLLAGYIGIAGLSGASQTGADQVMVSTASGPLIGHRAAGVDTFLGVPYAAPPTGELRWTAPQPAPQWTTPREALALGNVCSQLATAGPKAGQARGSEDCLFLNVYAPANAQAAGGLPVMVFIHGGGFSFGAGNDYDGSVLAQKYGVVAVTVNYRLGALGFVALPGVADGNLGLLDQQAALRWVRTNAGAFGGDGENVTLFGESAGGVAVCNQVASPKAAGLFEKAIVESGPCFTSNSKPLSTALAQGKAFASALGCAADDLVCLRAKTPAEVIKATAPGTVGPMDGTGVLPVNMREALQSGQFNRIPIMNGTNHDEGRFFVWNQIVAGMPVTAENYPAALASSFGDRAPQVLARYPLSSYASPALALSAVQTDSRFSCEVLLTNTVLSRYVPTYAYEFNDPLAVTTLPSTPDLPLLGSFHISEVAYIFQTPNQVATKFAFSPAQQRLADTMSSAWTAFAKTGNPATSAQPWPRFEASQPYILSLAPTRVAEAASFATDHQCAFWNEGVN